LGFLHQSNAPDPIRDTLRGKLFFGLGEVIKNRKTSDIGDMIIPYWRVQKMCTGNLIITTFRTATSLKGTI